MTIDFTTQTFVFGKGNYRYGGSYGPIEQEHVDLSYVSEGELTYFCDGKSFRITAGNAAFIYNQKHFKAVFEPKTVVTWCHSGALDLMPAQRVELRSLNASTTASPLLIDLLEQGTTLSKAVNPDDAKVRDSLGATAFYEYFRLVHLADMTSQLPASVLEARAHIVRHFDQPCSLAQIAEAAEVSPNYLLALFKTHLGCTPTTYLWNIRAENGVDLLQHTGLSIGEVALNCGFQSSQHFSRTIKARYGRTPTQIRAQKWEADPNQIDRKLNRLV